MCGQLFQWSQSWNRMVHIPRVPNPYQGPTSCLKYILTSLLICQIHINMVKIWGGTLHSTNSASEYNYSNNVKINNYQMKDVKSKRQFLEPCSYVDGHLVWIPEIKFLVSYWLSYNKDQNIIVTCILHSLNKGFVFVRSTWTIDWCNPVTSFQCVYDITIVVLVVHNPVVEWWNPVSILKENGTNASNGALSPVQVLDFAFL